MRVLVQLVAVGLGLMSALGYFGVVHPMADSFAVFRLPLLILFALVVVWTSWPRRVRWPLAGLAMVLMVPHLPLSGTSPARLDAPSLTLYQQNLLFSRAKDADWLALIREASPDVITLQEVSGRNKALLAALSDSHPTQHMCDFASVGGVAVLSRYPMVPGSAACGGNAGLAAMQVETGFGRVWLVSLHLHWPWPFRQAAQLEVILPTLEGLHGPVVLAGDFNAVGWSHAMARVERATRSRRVHMVQATFHLPKIAMPVTIDHALVPDGWHGRAQRMPKAGSDHHGLLVHLARRAT